MKVKVKKINKTKRDCSTCIHDAGFIKDSEDFCYMCCKGYENNYESTKQILRDIEDSFYFSQVKGV